MSTFSESILETSTSDNSSIFSTADTSLSDTSSSSTNWILWIVLALLAAFLGFALYNYLGGDLSTLFSTSSSSQSQTLQQESTPSSPSTNEKVLQNTLQEKAKVQPVKEPEPEVEADAANSSIQGGGKAGWCYIGEDRGFRSCAQVGVNDKCMSGEIFPSQEICVNPSLRA